MKKSNGFSRKQTGLCASTEPFHFSLRRKLALLSHQAQQGLRPFPLPEPGSPSFLPREFPRPRCRHLRGGLRSTRGAPGPPSRAQAVPASGTWRAPSWEPHPLSPTPTARRPPPQQEATTRLPGPALKWGAGGVLPHPLVFPICSSWPRGRRLWPRTRPWKPLDQKHPGPTVRQSASSLLHAAAARTHRPLLPPLWAGPATALAPLPRSWRTAWGGVGPVLPRPPAALPHAASRPLSPGVGRRPPPAGEAGGSSGWPTACCHSEPLGHQIRVFPGKTVSERTN